jgi:hypothetical protein
MLKYVKIRMVINMKNFTEEYITIGGIKIVRLIDDNGTKWYPLSQFFRKILFKNFNIQYYRDSSLIKHMQVIKYQFKEQTNGIALRTWFIDEYGLLVIISNAKVIQNASAKARIRERKLYEACAYFGINRSYDLKPIIIYETPDIKDYDEWAKICIESDENASQYNIWKKCEKCDRYYPNTSLYFEKKVTSNGETKLKRTCRQCREKTFIHTNPKKQRELQIGGIELVMALYKNKYTDALKIILNKKLKYTPDEFYQKDAAIELTKYVKNHIIDSKNEYYASNIAKILNMKTLSLYSLIKDDIKIGLYQPRKIKRKQPKKVMSETKLLKICISRFPNRISKAKLNMPEIEPIIGFLTKQGLAIICKNPKKVKNAKLYKFTSDIAGTENILKAIERMDIDEN